MTNPIPGRLIFLDESSNTGGFWAFEAADNFNPFPVNTYILHDGDVLTVMDANGLNQLWSGTISLQAVKLETQAVAGHWIRNTQAGVELKDWYTWFNGGFPASLVTPNATNAYPDYPYSV